MLYASTKKKKNDAAKKYTETSLINYTIQVFPNTRPLSSAQILQLTCDRVDDPVVERPFDIYHICTVARRCVFVRESSDYTI